MDFLGMQQILCFIALSFFNSWCYCKGAYLELEHEDTGIIQTNQVKPFHDKSVDSEMTCYMRCLDDQDHCCVIEIKQKAGKVIQCLLYNISTSYVKMTFEKNSKITSVIGRDCKPKPESCLEWYQKGEKENGVYEIDVNGNSTKAFCDMEEDDGGWTVFQRRINGAVLFNRTWNEYKNGFGDTNGDYWLGNDLIHQMTNKIGVGTLIKIKATSLAGDSKYIILDGFKIDGEKDKYKMHLGNVFEGDAHLKSSFSYIDGNYFSTIDEKNDNCVTNCAIYKGGGGYWYNCCSQVNPNSVYPDGDFSDSRFILWRGWEKNEEYTPLKFFQMSIK